MTKRVTLGLLILIVAGLFSMPFVTGVVTGKAAEDANTTIQLDEYFFQGPGGKSGDFNQPEVNIATITGAASGEIVIVLENTGKLEHEVLSTLFEATVETKIKTFDADGNEISKVETIGALREVELQPGMSAEVTLVLDESIVRTFEEDPGHEMTFELSCFVGHGMPDSHYKSGMRGLITLKP